MKPQTITFTTGDSFSAHLSLEWGGEAFDLSAAASAIFTAKLTASRPDTEAKIQKAIGAGITAGVAGWADVAFVPQDTLTLSVGLPYVWDLQAQMLDGSVRTVAAGTLTLQPGVTRETTTSIPVVTTETPLPIIIGEGGGASTPLSSSAPQALGATASAGTSSSAARGDHVHTRPSLAELGAAAASHTHPANAITEDSTHRFVTDAEKTAWNAGGGAGVDQTARDNAAAALDAANAAGIAADNAQQAADVATARANHTGTQPISTVDDLQTALDAKAASTHTHAATDITQDATHRFVTDSEKSTWNSAAGGGLANPMTTAGDLIVGGASGVPARLGIGTEGQVPTVRSGALVYDTPAAGGGGSSGIGIFQFSSNVHFHFAGDSLSNPRAGRTSWPEHLVDDNPWLASRVVVSNSASPGRAIAGTVSNYATSALPNLGGSQSWYFLWIGANNIAGSTPDTGAFLTAWIAHLQQLRTDGWTKIVAFTITRRSDGSNGAASEAARLVLNNVIRRRSDLYDYLIEPDVLFPDETNTTWYDDKVHLSPEANARLARHVAWVLSSNGAYNPTSGALITSPVATTQIAPAPAHTLLGNNTGSVAAPTFLTVPQVVAELPTFTGDSGSGGAKGLTPAPASGDAAAGRFLKADGTWAVPPAASGMSNPLTTLGDLLVAGAAGAPSRLPIGSNGQALQIVGGVPAWAPNASGFANPMTAAGDLIVGGVGGAAGRFPLGHMLGTLAVHPNGSLFWRSDRTVATLEEDFLSATTTSWKYTGTGTGASASVASDNAAPGCGVVRLKTGTTATGFAIVHAGTPTPSQYLMGSTPTLYRTYVRMPTLSDATESFRVFAGTAAGYASNINTIDHICFTYHHAEDDGEWRLTCRSGGAETSVRGVPVVADANYRLEWYFDGTQVTGWVNGVNIGSISTNIPTAAMGPICAIGKLAGTALQSSVYLDYIGLHALPNR